MASFHNILHRRLGAVAAVCGLTFALAAGPAFAGETYRTDYSISIFGLNIARSGFETKVNNGIYDLSGTLASSGIARIFDQVDGTIQVTGSASATGIVPSSYEVKYRMSRKNKRTAIAFSGGSVTNVQNTPPVKKRDPWVETGPNDLKSVDDPLSGLMIQATSPQAVCGRILHIFDGQTRADLQLSYSGTKPFSTQGFKGDAVTCSVKFIPISGYQKGKKAVEYLKNKSKISISFASLGNSGIYAPVTASIGTQIGTVSVYATRFEKVQ
ncbi:DUF3108 domain-containing protein [Phyllobacterium leguminum]|uniref:Uncharacterized protein DUF3108 n=1 Tax=Phyllobacterium leguminum TaxID=314237 RepID=A0A318T4K2_9HYPH|nr:DUF3108 domain-containing protein [Phyllobacterium leguminum]PYE89031.1 uncharacterized protein DUF3108 [Phyllobacterium leguminum]